MTTKPMRPIPGGQQQRGSKTVYITFNAPIVEKSAQMLIGSISEAMSLQPDQIHLAISSPGGNVSVAVGLYNMLKALPVEVITHNTGNVDSAANIVYMAGNIRYANQYSSFLFHGISINVPNGCSYQKLKELASQVEVDHRRIAQIISSNSGIQESDVEAFFQQGESLSVDRAIKDGIAMESREFAIPPKSPVLMVA